MTQPWELSSPDDKIRFCADFEAVDYFLDADFDFDPQMMAKMHHLLDLLGFVVMSGDECEPDIFDDYIRAYCARKNPTARECGGWPEIYDNSEFLPDHYDWRVGVA